MGSELVQALLMLEAQGVLALGVFRGSAYVVAAVALLAFR